MPQTVVRRYKNERAMQRGVTHMGSVGWRVVGQSSYTPKKGFIRWILGGFIFFNRRPEHMVTFQADNEVVVPTLQGEDATTALTPAERTALQEQWQQVYASRRLGSTAQLLHQKMVARAGLVVFNALWLFGAVTGLQVLLDVSMGLAIVLAVVDWTGVRSLGGRVNWALYRQEHPTLSIWAIIGLVLFFMVPVNYYLVSCLAPARPPSLTRSTAIE